MKKFDIDKFINNLDLVNDKINEYKLSKVITNVNSISEIQGHLLKVEHNLNFINYLKKSDFSDWAITGCYYAAYHAALALNLTKGYSSKNHLATLLLLIKEFYNDKLNKQDIENFSNILDYDDILFYVQSKNKREDASYSTKINFSLNEVDELKIKTILFVSKVKEIIKSG
jgi:uncharacterized protein (UPF0332 family)